MLPILRTMCVGGVALAILLPAPEDITGSIGVRLPEAGIPIDIGESSSTELPIASPEESPPVTGMPRRDSGSDQRWNGRGL
jgi:hypothetical protein